MKKIISTLFICMLALLTVALTACGVDNNGTYYPKSSEMKTNLEKSGYTVTVSTDLGDKNGTYLSATNSNDYIYFYWLDNNEDCEYFYDLLEENYPDYNSLVKIENDKKFGNIVYCGTKNAIDNAGIKVVDVKI